MTIPEAQRSGMAEQDALIVSPGGELAPVDEHLAQNPAVVYLASLGSVHSRRTMAQALGAIADAVVPGCERFTWCTVSGETYHLPAVPWGGLRYQHVAAIRAQLAERYKAASANKMLAALRGVMRAACNLGQLAADELHRVNEAAKTVKGSTVPAGRDLKAGEISALLRACMADATNAGVRDAAVIALGAVAGPRRAEIVSFDLADYDVDEARLVVRHGKGNKQRIVFLDNGARDAMADWLFVRGDEPGPLFLPVNKAGHIGYGQRMTSQAIYNMLEKRREEAGVKKFSPHDLRRTVAGDMLDAGVDINTVAAILGHANVTTTARYDRRGDERKRDAAAKLHVPYNRRYLP